MTNEIKSVPIPKEVNILYPWIKKYSSYDEYGNCIAYYLKDEKTGLWKDMLTIEFAKKELEKAKKKYEEALSKCR